MKGLHQGHPAVAKPAVCWGVLGGRPLKVEEADRGQAAESWTAVSRSPRAPALSRKRSEESVVFFLLRLSIGASSLIIFSSLPSLIASFLPPPFFPPFVYALAPLQAAER